MHEGQHIRPVTTLSHRTRETSARLSLPGRLFSSQRVVLSNRGRHDRIRAAQISLKQFLIYLAITLPFISSRPEERIWIAPPEHTSLLPLCEAAAVLDCPVGLHRRQPGFAFFTVPAFCALDLLGPAAALYERIAGYLRRYQDS